jgi:hypothetical protein
MDGDLFTVLLQYSLATSVSFVAVVATSSLKLSLASSSSWTATSVNFVAVVGDLSVRTFDYAVSVEPSTAQPARQLRLRSQHGAFDFAVSTAPSTVLGVFDLSQCGAFALSHRGDFDLS